MQQRVRDLGVAAGIAVLVVAGCGDDANDTRVDPDGQSVIDADVGTEGDEDTVITDPEGVTNQLDGNDGDREDPGQILDD